jgi:hypothetical protein
LFSPDASSVTVSPAPTFEVSRVTLTPICASSFSMVPMSLRCGTLVKVTGSFVSSAAHSSGRAAFFAPEMATSPESGMPPAISSLSIGFPFLGGQGLHRQRVQFAGIEARLEDGIDALLALDAIQPGKLAADDDGGKVMAVAFDGKVRRRAGRRRSRIRFVSDPACVTPQARSL